MRKRALFLLALLLAAAHAQARPHFLITPISYGPPGQNIVVPYAVNNLGQVTGLLAVSNPGLDWYPFFYSRGTVMPIFSAGGQSPGYAINNHGTIVGGSTTDVGSFIWLRGASNTTFFGPPNSFASDINNGGTVVGGPPAYMYKNGVLTDLGLGPSSNAISINNSGQIVGGDAGGAFLWQNGQRISLPLAGAVAINNKGDVLGYIQDAPGGPLRLVLYKNGQIENIVFPSNVMNFSASDLNDEDHVVGSVIDASQTERPFFWNGTFYDLNSLIPPNSDWVLQRASGINDREQIVGEGTLNGLTLGFILAPQ